jgi:membrane protein
VPGWVRRLEAFTLPLLGDRRVIRIRAVFDRFGRVGGGLLAAGIAFNVLFAVIPLAIFASGLIGFLVSDPAAQETVADFLTGLAPPLASFLDEAIGDLAGASASLTIIGLVGAAWGATRLYSSVELGVQAMFIGVKSRGIVAKTIRRTVFILVVAAVVVAAIVVSALASSFLRGSEPPSGVVSFVGSIALLALPYVLAVLAILVVYLVVPPVRPPRFAVWPPAFAAGVSIVAITQVFALIAPRLIGTNVFYGTLGTVFVTLAWLNLLSSILLIGAAWVRVRMLTDEEVLASIT